jgi:hypothetical protein
MGVDGIDSPGIAKTLRSLRDVLSSLEHEIEFVLARVQSGSGKALAGFARKLAESLAGDGLVRLARGLGSVPRIDLARLLAGLASVVDVAAFSRSLMSFLGVADLRGLESLRTEILALLDELSGVREREIALAGGVSQLRNRATRFDEALNGLARLQGRMIARLEVQAQRAVEVEKLAGRRDDHITRLIRDTASQRAGLERLERRFAQTEQREAEMLRRMDLIEVGADENDRLSRIEAQVGDLKRLQKSGIQNAIESLDGIRERIGRLEARAAEMSREARAKTGRLDALARHVASVEGKLTTAIGKGGGNVVTVAARKIEDFESVDAPGRRVGTS